MNHDLPFVVYLLSDENMLQLIFVVVVVGLHSNLVLEKNTSKVRYQEGAKYPFHFDIGFSTETSKFLFVIFLTEDEIRCISIRANECTFRESKLIIFIFVSHLNWGQKKMELSPYILILP